MSPVQKLLLDPRLPCSSQARFEGFGKPIFVIPTERYPTPSSEDFMKLLFPLKEAKPQLSATGTTLVTHFDRREPGPHVDQHIFPSIIIVSEVTEHGFLLYSKAPLQSAEHVTPTLTPSFRPQKKQPHATYARGSATKYVGLGF